MTHIAQFQDLPSVTPLSRLRLHIERHAYKKGAYAGAAPADTSRRGKSHFRVELTYNGAAVVFHQTRILRAFDDGSIMLDSAGWHESPTTRAALEHALTLAGYKGWLASDNRNGFRNTVLRFLTNAWWETVGWNDGITINPDGEITNVGQIMMYRADKEARKAWRESAQEFKAVLPVLFAALEGEPRMNWAPHPGGRMADAVLDPAKWPALVRYIAYASRTYDHAAAWAWLDQQVTGPMRDAVEE